MIRDLNLNIKLKEILEERNILQLELAEKAEISPKAISTIIRGLNDGINMNNLCKIAKALNIYRISDLIDFEYDDDKLLYIKNKIDLFVEENSDLFSYNEKTEIEKSFRRKKINLNFELFLKDNDFDDYQIKEILLGCLDDDLNVSIYAKEEFNHLQMKQIRLGLEDGLDVSFYASPDFDNKQMKQIKSGLMAGIDVTSFAKPELSEFEMEIKRKELIKNRR